MSKILGKRTRQAENDPAKKEAVAYLMDSWYRNQNEALLNETTTLWNNQDVMSEYWVNAKIKLQRYRRAFRQQQETINFMRHRLESEEARAQSLRRLIDEIMANHPNIAREYTMRMITTEFVVDYDSQVTEIEDLE